jgi:hypothetical protein
VADLHAMVEESEFRRLWNRGRTMTMDEAIEFALSSF